MRFQVWFAGGLAAASLAVVIAACSSDHTASDGNCAVDAAVDCGEGGASGDELGLVGYGCSGRARPDENATYDQGVPQGMVCADHGTNPDGTQAFCCTKATTPCAFNPVASCDANTYGYQCRGAYRPEALNPAINCGQGVDQGDLINYCCSGTPQPDACTQSNALGCSSRLTGWSCQGNFLPRSEELGASASHADLYYQLCPVPTPAANPSINNYCCYVPALVPEGGTCVQDTQVPGCAPGRFGFACYGPDTPNQDYLPMHCPDPGFAGKSAQGYDATLFCCDFQ